jgi:iron complex transport system substrate-binding protein
MRILSLLPSATEIVEALGLEGHLVGVTDECDWPPQARTVQVVSHSVLPAAVEPAEIDRLVSASIGGGQPLYRLDTSRHPQPARDLVLSQDRCAVCAVPSGQVTQALDVLGCQAEVVSLDPSSLDEVLDGVLQVGKAAGVPRAGRGGRRRAARAAGQGPGRRRGAGAAAGVRLGWGIRRSTAGTGCRRCSRSPVVSRCWPARAPRRCG